MNTCVFLTYNQLGHGDIPSGWHEKNGHKALVLQNTEGRGGLSDGPIGEENRVKQIDLLWQEMERELENLDHLVVYLGVRGSQRAIELLCDTKVPPKKITFVGCNCGLEVKTQMIVVAGLMESNRILCECGGHHTMEDLFRCFMETGEVPDH